MDPKAQVRESYNRIAAAYLSSRRSDSPDVALLDDLAARLPPRARVLDAGCGAGVPIAQRLAARAHVVGVDFAEVQLGLARGHVPTGHWVCADLVALPFAEASFDAVCSYYTVIHIPREQHAGVLDGFARVLRSRGLALLCLGAADLPTWTEQYHDAPMYWSHYDAATSLSMVKAAGFELVWHRQVADGPGSHLFVLAKRREARMTIRKLEAADWLEWRRMRCALWLHHTAAAHEAEMKTWLARPDATVAVCVRESGGLCGFVEAATRPYADGCLSSPVAFLEGWYVDPDSRGAGLGRLLVGAVETWARERGLRELASDALLDNEDSQKAHERLGFLEVERAVRYRKQIADAADA